MKLLIAEKDELFLVKLRIMILEYFKNVKITQALSGQEAVSFLEEQTFDILLVDVVLEDENASLGVALCGNRKNIPIIFLTGQRRLDLFKKVLLSRPDNYLT